MCPHAGQRQIRVGTGDQHHTDVLREALEQRPEVSQGGTGHLTVVEHDQHPADPGQVVGDGCGQVGHIAAGVVEKIEGIGPEVRPAFPKGVDQCSKQVAGGPISVVAADPDPGSVDTTRDPVGDRRRLARGRQADYERDWAFLSAIQLVEERRTTNVCRGNARRDEFCPRERPGLPRSDRLIWHLALTPITPEG